MLYRRNVQQDYNNHNPIAPTSLIYDIICFASVVIITNYTLMHTLHLDVALTHTLHLTHRATRTSGNSKQQTTDDHIAIKQQTIASREAQSGCGD
jgi:hypothetical protein